MSTDQPEITRETGATHGRYVVALEGGEAELTYSIASPTLIIADHTFVPPEHRSGNYALQMVERLVADARAEGVKIVPLCPYVASQARRHPEWADVFTR